MRKTSCLAAVIAGVAGMTGVVDAAPTLTLSSPNNPAALAVGQTIRIDVNVSGLTGQLEFLAAGVEFDDTLFSAPRVIEPGSIVPDGALSLAGEISPGFADGIFESLGDGAADRITGNGQFFSFELTATTAGSGQISLDFGDALRFNPDDPFMPAEPEVELGPDLAFTIVPEPSGVAAGLVGLFLFAGRRRRTR